MIFFCFGCEYCFVVLFLLLFFFMIWLINGIVEKDGIEFVFGYIYVFIVLCVWIFIW